MTKIGKKGGPQKGSVPLSYKQSKASSMKVPRNDLFFSITKCIQTNMIIGLKVIKLMTVKTKWRYEIKNLRDVFHYGI